MNDLVHASTFFLIFASVLILYGTRLAKTGDRSLIPYRATHSIHSADDVKHVGRIVRVVGLVVAIVALVVRFLAS